ncbi:MAG: 2-dehydropantoate 2-reductase [Gammaproteobacteria bacterium]|nr:2-dehydropantoate 2-reductase [Gammaproteobacteria bacterium]
MKICIYGAGAIGGLLGAGLARTGHEVSLMARGPHLAAMREHGLVVRSAAGEMRCRPRCTDSAAELGVQDYVMVTLKAHSVPGIVEAMQPLLGPGTAVVMAVNGVPWWYFYRLDGPWRDRRIACVDPDDVQWRGIGPERVIGCVVYPAAEIVAPGVIEHREGDRFALGEPSGDKTERIASFAQALMDAGFKAPIRSRIRDDIWIKLWGNLSFNPISALTGATLDIIATDPDTRPVARTMMLEAQAVAERLGVRFPIDVDRRIDGAAAVGGHKTSMLQDLELGRPMEIDALVTAVQEMGLLVEIPTPTLDMVLALVRQRARAAGCYPGAKR